MVKSQTLKLQKDSAMGVLHLVATSPGRLPKNHPFAPCKAYLEWLAAGGVRAQRVNLERAARIIGGVSIVDFDWRALTAADVELVRSRLRLEGYSSSTINGTLSALKGVARRAWRLGQMSVQEREAIRDIEGVALGHRARPARVLTFCEVKQLFEACDRGGGPLGARDACLLTLLYGAGLRANEAHRLNLSDFNPRAHSLRVHGKGDRDRTIYFREGGARRALHLWLRVRGRDEGELLRPVNRHGEILPRRLSYAGVYAALERRARAAGLSHITPHALRRSIGTHLLEKTKGDIDLVREYLGHVDVRTTQIYIHRGDRARRLAAENVSVPFRVPTGGRGRRKRRRRRRK
ncbi:MAG TPA: tyrosine-type recombinase/integrase [Pyrinomonadaceae bacterium]|nr:tyrosine-type recombinase/integrase [Pyrinomonadaceae bacterium]